MEKEKITRRKFIHQIGSAAVGIMTLPLISAAERVGAVQDTATTSTATVSSKLPDLVMAEGKEPADYVRKAIEEFGGMKRFVSKGDVVVVKPNMSWDRMPFQGATTNPDVVKTIVELAFDAGAKKVKVFDNTINNARSCYQRTGIMEKAKEAGADVPYVNPALFTTMKFPDATFLKEWPIYKEALDCDVLINVPIAKTHGLSRLTMAIKNLMGIMGGNRGRIHPEIHRALAELITKIHPTLTVLDASRIMIKNGPSGGSIKDIKVVNKCIVGTDQVAVDSYGATLFDLKADDIGYLRLAHQMQLGETNLQKLSIKELNVA